MDPQSASLVAFASQARPYTTAIDLVIQYGMFHRRVRTPAGRIYFSDGGGWDRA